MNINDISKYMDYLKESVKECIEKNDRDSANQIMEIIKLIRDYAKVLYLENRYKENEAQIKSNQSIEIGKIEQEIIDTNASVEELIDQARLEDLDEMISLKDKIQRIKMEKQRKVDRFSKSSFMDKIKEETMIIDKNVLIQNFLELSPIKNVLNSNINLIKDTSLNIPVIAFLIDILNFDLANYKKLSVIKEKNDKIYYLENKIKELKGYTGWIKSIVEQYNKAINSYIVVYDELSELLEDDEKYKKIFKVFPFLRFFMIDKNQREDIDSRNNDLKFYLSRINEFCGHLEKCPRVDIESINGNVDICSYYGAKPIQHDFNIGNKKISHYKYTRDNYIDIKVLDNLSDREMMEPLGMEILNLKREVELLLQQLPNGISELNQADYVFFVNEVLRNNELTPEYRMVKMGLNALLVLNSIDENFSDVFISKILTSKDSKCFEQQTTAKIKQYRKEFFSCLYSNSGN